MATNKLRNMKNKIKNIGFILGVFSLIFVGCKDKIDPIVEKLDFSRVFSPLNLAAKIRNLTTVELTWDTRADADSYVLEISEDSMAFTHVVKTLNVLPTQLPYSILLDGQTQYSARVKGVSKSGLAESKWSEVAFKTAAENILFPVASADIYATSVTIKWPAGSEVTSFMIVPGNIVRTITDPEKMAGVATITGLTGETDYSVKLLKGTKQRGLVTFKTLIDLQGATPVYPADDLSLAIANAKAGDVLVLFPGEYLKYAGDIIIDKSITLKGLLPFNKPIINVRFTLSSGVLDFYLKDIELVGTYGPTPIILTQAIYFNAGTYTVNSVKIEGCKVRDYNQALIYGGSAVVKVQSLLIDNCIMQNIVNDGGDFIDFRTGYVANLSITKSTFNKVASFPRDFIRLDNSAASFPGMVSNVAIDHCTLYGVSNSAARRILYVRFVTNTLKVTNTIIAETAGYYTNQSSSAQPECSMNNYYNAPGFITGGSAVVGAKFDLSTNSTLLNPGFVDAVNGNFKLTNQTLIDNNIGDPRWKP
jgi:hypothetical protein